jgi:hypothetical protein
MTPGRASTKTWADVLERFYSIGDLNIGQPCQLHSGGTCRAFRIFPRLFFKSPSPECGKTTLMDVVAPFVDKGLQAENSTTAALFRIIEQEMPTVFLDEADTFVKDNEEMRGIINSGHKREGKVLRVVRRSA